MAERNQARKIAVLDALKPAMLCLSMVVAGTVEIQADTVKIPDGQWDASVREFAAVPVVWLVSRSGKADPDSAIEAAQVFLKNHQELKNCTVSLSSEPFKLKRSIKPTWAIQYGCSKQH